MFSFNYVSNTTQSILDALAFLSSKQPYYEENWNTEMLMYLPKAT